MNNNIENVKVLVNNLRARSDHIKDIIKNCKKINTWLPDDIYEIKINAICIQTFAERITLECDKMGDQFEGKIVNNAV